MREDYWNINVKYLKEIDPVYILYKKSLLWIFCK